MITLENKRLHDFIVQKDALVTDGRKISKQIEILDMKIKRFEDKEKRITGKITPPKELTDRGEAILAEMNKLQEEFMKVSEEIRNIKLAAVPEDMKNEHTKLMKEREVLERDRNKIALKVQKIKDKVIPIVQKEVKPLLKEYDDIETATVKDGKVNITTFNHLEEFKKKFRK